jgi:hypothetical protein
MDGGFGERFAYRDYRRTSARLHDPGRELPRDAARFFCSAAHDEHVGTSHHYGDGDPKRLKYRRRSSVDWSKKLFDAHAKDPLQKSCRRWPDRAEWPAVRASSGDESLQVPDAERAGFIVLARESLGVLRELFESLLTLPDLLFKHRAHRQVR